MRKVILASTFSALLIGTASSSSAQYTPSVALLSTLSGLEKAWACLPTLAGSALHKGSRPSEIGYHYEFENSHCLYPDMPKDEQDRLMALLAAEYGDTNAKDNLGRERFRKERPDKIKEAYGREAAARAQQAGQTNAAIEDRKRLLKSGRVKISSIKDAALYHDPTQTLPAVIQSPLLSPDSAMYRGCAVLDGKEQEEILRAKALRGVAYVFLKTSTKTKNFSPSRMRIGETVCLVGRYVGNVKYRTVIGEPKIAPLINVLYFGAPCDPCASNTQIQEALTYFGE
jgi:hypothetical protein